MVWHGNNTAMMLIVVQPQVKYVVELARALGSNPAVRRVDLLTRLITGERTIV
jgi:hypothetical protein